MLRCVTGRVYMYCGFLSAPIVTPLAALLGGGVLPRFALGAGLALAFAAAAFFLARTLRAKV